MASRAPYWTKRRLGLLLTVGVLAPLAIGGTFVLLMIVTCFGSIGGGYRHTDFAPLVLVIAVSVIALAGILLWPSPE